MKMKRFFLLLLCAVMILSLLPAAFAAEDPNYALRLHAEEHTVGDTSGLALQLQVKSEAGHELVVGASVNLLIKVDPDVLSLANKNGGALTVPGENENWKDFIGAYFLNDYAGTIYSSRSGCYKTVGEYTYVQFIIFLDGDENGEAVSTNGTWQTISAIYVTYSGENGIDDLNQNSISLLTTDEAYAAGQNCVAFLRPDGMNDNELSYGDTAITTSKTPDDLAKPEIVYPNSTVAALPDSPGSSTGNDSTQNTIKDIPEEDKEPDLNTGSIVLKTDEEGGDFSAALLIAAAIVIVLSLLLLIAVRVKRRKT